MKDGCGGEVAAIMGEEIGRQERAGRKALGLGKKGSAGRKSGKRKGKRKERSAGRAGAVVLDRGLWTVNWPGDRLMDVGAAHAN